MADDLPDTICDPDKFRENAPPGFDEAERLVCGWYDWATENPRKDAPSNALLKAHGKPRR